MNYKKLSKIKDSYNFSDDEINQLLKDKKLTIDLDGYDGEESFRSLKSRLQNIDKSAATRLDWTPDPYGKKLFVEIRDSKIEKSIKKQQAHAIAKELAHINVKSWVSPYFDEVVIDIPKEIDYKNYNQCQEYLDSLHIPEFLESNGFEEWYPMVEDIDEEIVKGTGRYDEIGSCYIVIMHDDNDYSQFDIQDSARSNYDKWLTAWLYGYKTADDWYAKLSPEEKEWADREILNAAEEAKYAFLGFD